MMRRGRARKEKHRQKKQAFHCFGSAVFPPGPADRRRVFSLMSCERWRASQAACRKAAFAALDGDAGRETNTGRKQSEPHPCDQQDKLI
jgi:hypothetical protein